MSGTERGNPRPTQDWDIEILIPMPMSGDDEPGPLIAIGAGSWADFDKAKE